MGFVLSAGGGGGEGSGEAERLTAGSPVGAELVRGDMRIAATGTVTASTTAASREKRAPR